MWACFVSHETAQCFNHLREYTYVPQGSGIVYITISRDAWRGATDARQRGPRCRPPQEVGTRRVTVNFPSTLRSPSKAHRKTAVITGDCRTAKGKSYVLKAILLWLSLAPQVCPGRVTLKLRLTLRLSSSLSGSLWLILTQSLHSLTC